MPCFGPYLCDRNCFYSRMYVYIHPYLVKEKEAKGKRLYNFSKVWFNGKTKLENDKTFDIKSFKCFLFWISEKARFLSIFSIYLILCNTGHYAHLKRYSGLKPYWGDLSPDKKKIPLIALFTLKYPLRLFDFSWICPIKQIKQKVK